MRRRGRSWTVLGLQAGLLAGVGLALVGGAEPPSVRAAPMCFLEGQCTYVKPLLLLLVDYSTAMNQPFVPGKTRWQAAVEAIGTIVDDQNGYLQGNALLGLMRFGHDASPGLVGTKILGDVSSPPLVDGVALDVGFYDPDVPGKPYLDCNGEAIKAAIAGQKAPMDGAAKGIGAWTRGALGRGAAYIEQTIAEHPNDKEPRTGTLIVLTQGAWTDPSGTLTLKPPAEDPVGAAAALFNEEQIPTWVLSYGDANGKAAADALAAAGATGEAVDGKDPAPLLAGLLSFVEDVKSGISVPICTPSMPRIMVLLGASSAMLNTGGGKLAGAMGETPWDRARAALAGDAAIFDQIINGIATLEQRVYLGLTVFGGEAPPPGEQRVLLDYESCGQAQVAWALDPATSCAAPGCVDPWGGPPITWTFKDGSQSDPPGFDAPTLSHMPRCDEDAALPLACSGSGAQLHLGLELVQANLAAYKAKCAAPGYLHPCSEATKFINLLVTDGNDESDDAAVQARLEEMFAAGVTTYVFGIGDVVDPVRLQQLAAWGSGGAEGYFAAEDQLLLQLALAATVGAIEFDPCCSFASCADYCLNAECDDPDPFCGDGVVNGGEACDDGNGAAGDGCEPDCTPTQSAVCGNGVVEGREECDDGNLVDGDGCDASCSQDGVTSDGCGNGIVEGSEECDDGNATPGDGCEPECTLTPEGGSSGTTDGEPASTTTDGPETGGVVPTTGEAPGTGGETGGEGSTGGETGGEGSTGGASVEDGGCGCAAEGTGARGFAWLLALGWARRRRRRR